MRRIGTAFLIAILLLAHARLSCSGEVNGHEANAVKAPLRLHIIGGLANVHQFQRHEVPFWTERVPALTGGRVTADIVPFDKAGVPGNDLLRLMSAGAVPFGTALLGVSSSTDPEFGAVDLAGLSADMSALHRRAESLRPHLQRVLKERYGLRLLALYAYPAQVLFCRDRFKSLKDLAGRRIRTATPSQSDFFEALGAHPVRTSFSELLSHMNSGNTSCAVTGAMSGNTIGLHQVTGYLSPLTISWGMSLFAANEAAWQALPLDIQQTIGSALRQLEADVWADADRETQEGVACNVGARTCANGSPGQMQLVQPTAEDARLRTEVFQTAVLPRWFMRCGEPCEKLWTTRMTATPRTTRAQ